MVEVKVSRKINKYQAERQFPKHKVKGIRIVKNTTFVELEDK